MNTTKQNRREARRRKNERQKQQETINVKLVTRSMVIPENMETGLIRKRLIDSGNDICIRAGKTLPTKEINIIQRNVINFWPL